MSFLGIDIGGSGIKGAPVCLETGKLETERLRIPTPQPATPTKIIEASAEIVRHFDVLGPVGFGFPAVIKDGTVRTAANIHTSWIGLNAAELMERTTNRPVVFLNDADAAGLAEMRFGAGRGRDGVVVIATLGTGIGTSLFVNGMLVPSTEFGHIEMKGHVAEKYAAESVRKTKELSWMEWGDRVNEYLCKLDELIRPDLIIVGGGASNKYEKFSPYFTLETEVVPAQLRNKAGIIGAALAARGSRSLDRRLNEGNINVDAHEE